MFLGSPGVSTKENRTSIRSAVFAQTARVTDGVIIDRNIQQRMYWMWPEMTISAN